MRPPAAEDPSEEGRYLPRNSEWVGSKALRRLDMGNFLGTGEVRNVGAIYAGASDREGKAGPCWI
jgi:hypothetical protein